MAKKITALVFMSMILFSGSFSAVFATDLTDLKYVTEVYPPFNYEDNGKLKGVAVDLLKAIWREMGVEEQKIEVLPWARAYKLAQTKKNTVLFSTTRSPERESLFKWAGPIKSNPIGFIARKESQIKVSSLSELRKMNLGTVRDDFCESALQEKGFDLKSFDRVSELSTNLKKLKNRRIDIIVNSVEGTFIAMEKEGYNPEEYMVVGILSDVPLSYAFHKDVPQGVVDAVQKVIDAIESTRQEILTKYGLKEQRSELLQ